MGPGGTRLTYKQLMDYGPRSLPTESRVRTGLWKLNSRTFKDFFKNISQFSRTKSVHKPVQLWPISLNFSNIQEPSPTSTTAVPGRARAPFKDIFARHSLFFNRAEQWNSRTFQGLSPKTRFHGFPGLENTLTKFKYFQAIHGHVRTLKKAPQWVWGNWVIYRIIIPRTPVLVWHWKLVLKMIHPPPSKSFKPFQLC